MADTKETERLTLSDEMLDRGAAALGEEGHDASRAIVRAVIEASFEDVPLANFGAGLLLAAEHVDMVVLYRHGDGFNPPPACLLLVPDPKKEGGLYSLGHTLNVNLRPGQSVPTRLDLSKISVPR